MGSRHCEVESQGPSLGFTRRLNIPWDIDNRSISHGFLLSFVPSPSTKTRTLTPQEGKQGGEGERIGTLDICLFFLSSNKQTTQNMTRRGFCPPCQSLFAQHDPPLLVSSDEGCLRPSPPCRCSMEGLLCPRQPPPLFKQRGTFAPTTSPLLEMRAEGLLCPMQPHHPSF